MKRIGMLTSGGDCQALNATMRGVAKGLYNIYGNEVEIIGFIDGYKGLIYEDYKKLSPIDFTGLLTRGGTILGSSRQPFKLMRVPDENGLDKVEAMKYTYRRLRLDGLVVLGGNGSQKTANLLSEEGLNVIGLPKTIDNDLWGTDTTFGFQSAIGLATEVIDCIHTTAASHNRVFMVEVMGHKAGWLTLNAGSRFTILAVAEGAMSKKESEMSKKEYKQHMAEVLEKYPSVSYAIADKILKKTGKEVRVTVPGHMQRGGTPCAYDRVLSSRLGTTAALMISKGEYGNMVAIHDHVITSVPLKEVAGKLKTIDPKSDIIAEARLLGISFGDD